MDYDFNKSINRYNSNSIKWDKYKKNIIPLWIADSDFRVPNCILESLEKRIRHGIFGYGNTVPKDLVNTIIHHLYNNYKWKIEPEWIIFLPGIISGLNICIKAFTNKNESTISPSPIYPPFRKASLQHNRNQVYLPLKIKNNRWIMDLTSFKEKKTGKEKLLMLCNPHNPCGTVYSKKELEEHLNFACRHNLIVCSDEVHFEIILNSNATHIPFANLNEEAAKRTITLISPSKSFNIAGLTIAMAIIPNPKFRKRFKEVSEGFLPSMNILSILAATEAWKNGKDWLNAQLNYLKNNRDYLKRKINNIFGLSMIVPDGTYLAWIDTSTLNIKNPASWFEKYGVGLSSGKEFGNDKFVRLNFGCTRNLLSKAIQRIEKAVLNI